MISFDQYQRYATIGKIVSAMQQKSSNSEKIKVLEVGSNAQCNLEKFVDAEIFYTDILEIEDFAGNDHFFVADATNLVEIEDDTFDYAIASDVFEHIPSDLREAFLSELNRVSKKCAIICFPFSSKITQDAEERVNQYYKSFRGKDYIWLQEHIENGLPDLDNINEFLNARGIFYSVCQHGSVKIWEEMMKAIFSVTENSGLVQYREDIDQYYIDNVYSYDLENENYRAFYVLSKNNETKLFANQIMQNLFVKNDAKREHGYQQIVKYCNGLHDMSIAKKQYLDYENRTVPHLASVYFNTGEGFLEENRQIFQCISQERKNIYEIDGLLANSTDEIRFDFTEKYMCEVYDLSVCSDQNEDLDFETNALRLNDNLLFKTTDPQIIIKVPKGVDKITISFWISMMLNSTQEKLFNQKYENYETLLEMRKEQLCLEEKNQQLEIAYRSMEHNYHLMEHNYHLIASSHFWRMTKPFRFMVTQLKRIYKNKLVSMLYKAFDIWHKEGWAVLRYKINNKILQGNSAEPAYESWLSIMESNNNQVLKLDYQPLVSVVVPVYNVPKDILIACIESVLNQTYQNYELCIADDASTLPDVKEVLKRYENNDKVKIVYRKENGHISRSTNSAIELASGEYVAFMDCDDTLAKNALYEVVKLLNENPELDYIYSDEDKLSEDGTHRHTPHFKPDWSPDTLISLMYTSHLSVYRKEIGDKLGWLRVGFEGAQDYDFTLRFTEKTENIGHIPKILYHWRERNESTSTNIEAKDYVVNAMKKAKTEALERRGFLASLEWIPEIYQWRVCYKAQNEPLVSVIIPSKDNFAVYQRCIDTLIKNTTYKNYEIITVDNGSSDDMKKQYENYAVKKSIQYIYQPMEFNFSRMCNLGVQHSHGEYILLLNDDMEILSKEWMGRMVGHAALPYIGAVGAKLLYPNTSLIQHVGVVAFDSGPSHTLCQYSDEDILYFNRNRIEYNYSAVTGACLMVSKEKYDAVGGMDENFAVAYNDVNFCYNLIEKGYYNVVRNDAILYHHESLSRGNDVMDPVKFERLRREREKLNHAHPLFAFGDPWYNPNLTMKRGDYSLNMDIIDRKKTCSISSISIPQYSESETNRAEIQQITKDNQYIQLTGYFVIPESKKNNSYVTHIILLSGDNAYQCSAKKEYQPNINLLTGCTGKNNLSGFCAVFDTETMEDGSYQIVLEKNGLYVDSGKEVEIHNNIPHTKETAQ